MNIRSGILKLALFATGLSGIVAEYILATLATYFLGDSVFQWTLIISVMMFSMGLGSRLSKSIKTNLLLSFVFIEFLLSFLVASSAMFAYSVAAYTIYSGLIIYSLSIAIGILIGMEIPLAIRLNHEFEELRINIANIVEKDYYGSLLGGLFFAFVGLPYLGLTYTPLVLGLVNFLVALTLLFLLWDILNTKRKQWIGSISMLILIVLISLFFIAKPLILYGEQNKYKDKIVFEHQSRYQKIVITQWKNHYWLYINGNQQLSSIDEVLYHEPLVHPVMQLHPYPQQVLILGGGDGCAAREVLKYSSVDNIVLVDLDPAITRLAQTNRVITDMNNHSLSNTKVEIINSDGYTYIENTLSFFDVIIIDLPDPKTVELSRLYSREFYTLCYKHLRPGGVLITQAGSPYFATKAFLCIGKTIERAGFTIAKMHNQIITLGEWGWIIGAKEHADSISLKEKLQELTFENTDTKWINKEAMQMMTSFGKNIYISRNNQHTDDIEINTIHNPVLQRYYLRGNWDLY